MSATTAHTTPAPHHRPDPRCESCSLHLEAHEVAPEHTGLALCDDCWEQEFALCAAIAADETDPAAQEPPDSAELAEYEAAWRARQMQIAAAH